MGSHSVTCHQTEVWIPLLPPAEAGTRFSDPGRMQAWVDPCYVKADRLEIEPAIASLTPYRSATKQQKDVLVFSCVLRTFKPHPHPQQCRSNVRLCWSNIRLCCHKRQQSPTFIVKFRPFDKVETNWTCSTNRSTCSIRQCCMDIVASMDGALGEGTEVACWNRHVPGIYARVRCSNRKSEWW